MYVYYARLYNKMTNITQYNNNACIYKVYIQYYI